MQKRKDLTLADKVRVLECLSQKKSQTSLAAEFGVSQSQISRIGKNRELIMSRYLQSDNSDRKRNRDGKNVDIETALLRWYTRARASCMPISGPILMDKAKELALKFDISDFLPSISWLQQWKERHQIGLRRSSEENKDSDADCVESWVNQVLPKILKEYHPDDVYCCMETALYYKTLPESESNEESQNYPRLTVLLCCNMSGKDKKVPYIIGSRREYEKNTLPPCIVNSDSALMNSHLFTKWLMDLDSLLEREDRSICLVLEKCVVHAIDFPLNNIKWFYTPTSNVFQLHPMNLGIMRNFKCHYRRELLTVFGILQGNLSNPASEHLLKSFNMTAAVGLIGDAWRKVTASTVVTCFHMAMFTSEGVEPSWVEYVTAPSTMTEEEFSAYVDIDSTVQCCDEPDYGENFPIFSRWEYLESIVASHSPTPASLDSDGSSEPPVKMVKTDQEKDFVLDKVITKPEKLPDNCAHIASYLFSNGIEKVQKDQEKTTPVGKSIPSSSEALEACRTLRQYLEHHGIDNFSPFYEIDLQVRSVMASAKRQKLRANHLHAS